MNEVVREIYACENCEDFASEYKDEFILHIKSCSALKSESLTRDKKGEFDSPSVDSLSSLNGSVKNG